MSGFLAFNIHDNQVLWNHDLAKPLQWRLRGKFYITVPMLSFHILWHEFLFVFPNSTAKLKAVLRCTFGAHINGNAMKRGIQFCIF